MKAIDLFAGCGGLSLGFLKAGFEINQAVEFDPAIANTYKSNHPDVRMYVDDIKNIDESKVLKKGDADVIIGGPPCQGFSMAGARIRQGFIDDPRNYLFKHYYNIVRKVRPKAFVMENVKGMLTMQQGKIFKEIISVFTEKDSMDGHPYHLYYKVVKATDFGIPQGRERLIIIGTEDYVPIDELWDKAKDKITNVYPSYFNKVNVRDAIGNLPMPTKNGIINNPVPETEYQKYLSCSNKEITNHKMSNHSAKAIERMHQIGVGQNYTQLNEEIKSVHSGSYGRLSWDEPATTITTRFDTPAGGRFIHPDFDRTITPREAARIQSFPDSFVFTGANREISRQIGNAVPPKISYFLGMLMREIINYEV